MKTAVFVDRDGVINPLIFNPQTRAFESPHTVEDFSLLPGVLPALQSLLANGYLLFLVSNQPSYALGKTSMANLQAIQRTFDQAARQAGIVFTEYYYCYHHPRGTVAGYAGECQCRKPKPFFLHQAAKDHQVNLAASWMIGDQDRDIDCGQAAGVHTILVEYPDSSPKRGKSNPEFRAQDLPAAAMIIRLGKSQ